MMSEPLAPPFRGLSDNGVKVVILISVFWALSTLFVGLRFYARYLKNAGIMIEDWLVMGALISFYGFGIVNLLAVTKGGAGYHVTELGPSQLQYNLKVLLCGQIFYAIGLGLVKCSITAMLIRIFAVKSFRIAGYVVLAICVSWGIMTMLVAFLLCRPLGYNWNLLPSDRHCGNQQSAYAAVGVTDILTDVMILILPLPMIWRLQLPIGNKIALAGLLCLGIFTIAMSIARTVSILKTNFSDFTYDIYNYVWPVVEFGVAIVVACGPILRPMFRGMAAFRTAVGSSKQNSRMQNSTMNKRKGYGAYSDLTEDDVHLKSVTMHSNTVVTAESSYNGEGEHGASEPVPKNGIAVKTQWDCV